MDTPAAMLLLQMVLYFNKWYLVFLYASEGVLLIYKAVVLPYPARNFWPELLLLIAMVTLDILRLFFGVKGNLTRRRIPLLLSVVLLLPLFFGYLYLTIWQTYVFTFEVITVVIALLGFVLQLMFTPLVLWTIHRSTLTG